VIHLLPTNSLLPRPDLANDRHLYLACFGPFLAVGIEVARAVSPRPRAWAAVAVVTLLLAAATVVRNRDYWSEVALWEQTATVSPAKPRVFNNLGVAYEQAGARPRRGRLPRGPALHPGYDLARGNLDRINGVRLQFTLIRRKSIHDPLRRRHRLRAVPRNPLAPRPPR
jgi:hypothetical protein